MAVRIHYIGYGDDSYTDAWVFFQFGGGAEGTQLHVRKRPGQRNVSPIPVSCDGIGDMFTPGGCPRWAITLVTKENEDEAV